VDRTPNNWRSRLRRATRHEPEPPTRKASEPPTRKAAEPDHYALVAGHVVDLMPDGDGLQDAVAELLRREFGFGRKAGS
jgi:hypothetical protein